MKPLLALFACVLFLAGCGSSPVSSAPAASEPVSALETVEVSEISAALSSSDALTSSNSSAGEYPIQIVSSGYQGPDCWLLSESDYKDGDATPKIYNCFVDIDMNSENLRDDTKEAFINIATVYPEYAFVTFKLYNDMEGDPAQMFAMWESETTEIMWYPEGAAPDKPKESEVWSVQ